MEGAVTCALCNSLGSNGGKSLPNTEEAKKNHARIHYAQSKFLDDGITEDEIFQLCFGQPKLERPASESECHQSILILCQSLLYKPNQPKGASSVCNVCGTEISIRQNKNIVHHACAHFDIKLFKCRHCNHSMNSRDSIRRHIRQTHNLQATNENFEDKTVERFEDVCNWIKRCFSTDYPRAPALKRQSIARGNCSGNSRQRSITHLCRSIYIQRSKRASLECNLCGFRISLQKRSRGSFDATSMSQHAAAHLEVKLFTCLHCNQPISTKFQMRQHLRGRHQIVNGNNDDFDDQSEEQHSEYLSMIERCFSADQVKLEVSSTKHKTTIRGEATIRLRCSTELEVKRHLFCNQLIKKGADCDRKIKCSLCSKRLCVKRCSGQTDCKAAFLHAETHLKQPLYRCKMCGSQFNTLPVITWHLKKTHALGIERNHECVADEFHEEIMSMLSKCYAVADL